MKYKKHIISRQPASGSWSEPAQYDVQSQDFTLLKSFSTAQEAKSYIDNRTKARTVKSEKFIYFDRASAQEIIVQIVEPFRAGFIVKPCRPFSGLKFGPVDKKDLKPIN